MFWKGRVSFLKQIDGYFKQKGVELSSLIEPSHPMQLDSDVKCTMSMGTVSDSKGIADLLNEWFETGKAKTTVSADWVLYTFLQNSAIWITAKDSGGTIRGCITSFKIQAPYPNSLVQCGQMSPWGLVDWFCVHPLWRGRGVASALLETLDYITYRIGRKAHVFLKEGIPLPLPNIPIYSTILRCRNAGTEKVKQMRVGTGLIVHDYHCIEKESGLPMIRVEGIPSDIDISEWEDTLDRELPRCWVFVSGSNKVDPSRGWKTDSLVSLYAFRWTPGKWLFTPPIQDIL